MVDVLVIGGGNAALCAALMAREAGASVLLLEAAPRAWRGGNSMHVRNLRCMHDAPQDVLIEAYPEEEYWQDLLKVTGGKTDEALARLVIRASATCRPWMQKHGVHFQPPLSGALHVARTNAFFMGGGKALVNAYYRSAQRLGVQVRYESPVERIELDGDRFVAAWVGNERIAARSCVLAAGGFESNRGWLREAWGQNASGEWPADNFLIRGTRFNTGVLLKQLMALGADTTATRRRPTWWPSTHARRSTTAASAPGWTASRSVSCSTARPSASTTKARTSGPSATPSGAGWWPSSPGRSATASSTPRRWAASCRRCSTACRPTACRNWRASSVWTLSASPAPWPTTTRPAASASFDHTRLDDCHTEGLAPAKTHWALPIDTPPFYGYALRPGVTFTYLGLKVGASTAVQFGGRPSANLFVAGEMMAGNVLGQGYTAGVGMSIGTAFGRIAGTQAAAATGHRARTEGNVHVAA